jgi:serine/threonine-protein phosphatase 2A regulatory subunit B''
MLDVNYFLRAIRRETLEIVGTQVNVEDVKDELFDIVKPSNPDRITLDDLIACRQGGTGLDVIRRPHSIPAAVTLLRAVVAILADWQSFYEHDNKENQLAASAADDQET